MRHIVPLLLRLFLPCAGLLLSQAPLRAQEGGAAPFVLALQWTAQAQFAGYYVAREKGFYHDVGLDVRLVHCNATQPVQDRVRQGQGDAFTLVLSQALELVDEGIPLANVLQTAMRSGLVMVSRWGKDPLAQKGMRVATWRAGFSQLPKVLARAQHLDCQWVEAAGSVNLFIAGAVDAALAMSYNEYVQIRQAGLARDERQVYRFEGHDYDFPEDGVYVPRDALRRHPGQAERFAAASRKGWEWTAQHPKEALDIVMEYVRKAGIPTNRILQQCMLEEVLRLQLDPESGERAFRLDSGKVERLSHLMCASGLLRGEVSPASLMP